MPGLKFLLFVLFWDFSSSTHDTFWNIPEQILLLDFNQLACSLSYLRQWITYMESKLSSCVWKTTLEPPLVFSWSLRNKNNYSDCILVAILSCKDNQCCNVMCMFHLWFWKCGRAPVAELQTALYGGVLSNHASTNLGPWFVYFYLFFQHNSPSSRYLTSPISLVYPPDIKN